MQPTAITIPTIDTLPTSPIEAARFIWEHQNRLNQVSHPRGLGTIRLDKHLSAAEHEAVARDYHLALLSEVAELMANGFWKHWSKEARDGRRWHLINPSAATGEGSVQNVHVEVIDLAFFAVSSLQVCGMTRKVWAALWGDEQLWAGPYHNPAEPAGFQEVLRQAQELATAVGRLPLRSHPGRVAIIDALRRLCMAAGLRWDTTLALYAQKLIKNYERQQRGRLQVGDALAERENASVALPPSAPKVVAVVPA